MHIVLLIPAYKPDEKLLKLLCEVSQSPYEQIIVVDDGSGDAYASIFAGAREIANVTVLSYMDNKGKGGALKHGFAYIAANFAACNVVTADADGQHTPQDILRVATATEAGDGVFVIGGRAFDKDVPARSRFGNTFMRWAFLISTGRKVYDTQSGLRGFPARYIAQACTIKGERYEYEMNVLLDIAKNGYPIEEITIHTIYIEHNASSHFNPVRDALRVLVPLLKFAASSLISFGADYAMYIVFIEALGLTARVAYVCARAISAVINFTLNKTMVFKGKGDTLQQLGKYALLSGSTMALGYFGVRLLTQVGVNGYFAKILVDTLLFCLSFLGQRLLVFRVKKRVKNRE